MMTKLTALIRTHPGREELTKRAVESAGSQGCEVHLYHGEKVSDFSYNLYCQILKAGVPDDSFFFFLDSDDFVIEGAVQKLLPYLTDPDTAYIVRMLRNGRPKPAGDYIRRGLIGLPCLVLHAKHKHLADITPRECGDFDWIKAVTDKLKTKYLPITLVNAGSRSRGK